MTFSRMRTLHGDARASRIPLVEQHLAARILAPRPPQSGAPSPAHQSRLVYLAPWPMPMGRCTPQVPSSFRAAAVSTVLVQTVAAQVFIVWDP
jgi:hypothetical protein